MSRLHQCTDLKQSSASRADFHLIHFRRLLIGFAKQNVQGIRQQVRHQFVTVRKEAMPT